jgi:3-hydroxybutyryl-CoA dehydratase
VDHGSRPRRRWGVLGCLSNLEKLRQPIRLSGERHCGRRSPGIGKTGCFANTHLAESEEKGETSVSVSIDQIKVGDRTFLRRKLTEQDIDQFASLTGDLSPLHMDNQYASSTPYGRRLVHGMFLASLVSCLVGMHLFGTRIVCLSQSFDFVQPVYAGEEVEVSGVVQHKQEATNTLVLRTQVSVLPDRVAVRGKAIVKIIG